MGSKSQKQSVKPLFLIAGEYRDYFSIRALVAVLPESAFGQIFIEVGDVSEIQDFPRPRRMQITWLVTEQSTRGNEAGSRLCQAVHAWLEEWQVDDWEREHSLELWLGGMMNPRISSSWQNLSQRFNQ